MYTNVSSFNHKMLLKEGKCREESKFAPASKFCHSMFSPFCLSNSITETMSVREQLGAQLGWTGFWLAPSGLSRKSIMIDEQCLPRDRCGGTWLPGALISLVSILFWGIFNLILRHFRFHFCLPIGFGLVGGVAVI